jgi:hypothetical protein
MKHTTCALAALLVAALPCAALAQEAPEIELKIPQARQGYYLGGGLMTIFNQNYQLQADDTGVLSGGGAHVRLGQMINDWFGAGLWIGGGGASDDRFSAGFGGVMLDLQVVPWDHLGFHVGVGGGGLSLTDAESETDELLGTGGGYYLASVSYDWFPFYERGSGGFSVTPSFQVQYFPGQVFDGLIYVVGLDLLWWTGLEKNKLDLPIDEAFTAED